MMNSMLMNFIQDVNLDAPETMNQVQDNGFHPPLGLLFLLIIICVILVVLRIKRNRQE